MIKLMSDKDKNYLEDKRDERDFFIMTRDDIRRKIMKHETCSFKVDTGMKLLGEPVLEFYYIRRYEAHDDMHEVDMTCLITNKIREIRIREDDLLELTNNMVL
tara:strand:+ start:262 stop:570 length:309 start_codon:yes stop_codon:yes gene_type:complete